MKTAAEPAAELTESEILDVLRVACAAAGTQRNWAKANGFHPSFVGDVLKGRKDISARLLDALGYEFVGHYRKKD